ncbi:MAG TPA: DNA-binding response regulator [Flavobacteriaceae bacterium]|jgi:DNA-binding response OmpR family regulator|nr:DNA-binding response regulator [Flavobacteriaceae bacterium]
MKNHNYRLLLVEDDDTLGHLLSEYLKIKGFDVRWAQFGDAALKLVDQYSFDLIILDVMLPDIDGFSLAEELSADHHHTPFVFLTARSFKIDVLKGFSLGAVDYLKKPIDEEELVVRINTLLSRYITVESDVAHILYQIGRYNFHSVNQQLVIDDQVITLTKRESEILLHLVSNVNELCTHKVILTRLWGKSDYFNKKSLNVFISHLRRYLALDARVSIQNLHNKGFILRVDQ